MKKIFTLIAFATMTIAVNAQTTISLKGLTFSSFKENSYEQVTNFVEKNEDAQPTGYTAPYAYTYNGNTVDGAYLDLELKDQPLKFTYKNSGVKVGFFSMTDDFFQIGGKGAKMTLSDVKKSQTVTLTIAAKEDGNAPEFSITGAELTTGSPADATSKSSFVDVVYTVTTAGGNITIENVTNAYRIQKIVITGEGVEAGTFDGNDMNIKWSLSDPTDLSATPSNKAGMEAATVSVGEGLSILDETQTLEDISYIKLQPTSNEKGKNEYKSCQDMKKYIDFTFTPKAAFAATKVEFDAIKIGTGDPQLYVDYIEGDGSINTIAEALVIRKSSEETPSVHHSFEVKSFASDKAVTLRIYVGKCAYNKQVGIANVVISGKIDKSIPTGIESVKTQAIDLNAPAYNLAGQKVSNDFKGLVIKNGKKFVVK